MAVSSLNRTPLEPTTRWPGLGAMARDFRRSLLEAVAPSLASQKTIVRDGTIELSLLDCGASGFLLQRRHVRFDGSLAIQKIDATDGLRLDEFIEGDPHYDALTSAYRLLVSRLNEVKQNPTAANPLTGNVTDCQNELEVLRLMRQVCEGVGGTSCVYHWVRAPDDARRDGPVYDTHVVLASCPPAWIQAYERRMAADPVMEYARDNNAPLRGFRQLNISDSAWLAGEAQLYGLRSNVFFPARRRDGELFGLLHVSSGDPAPEGEERLWQNQRVLRGLAEEMLDWPAIQYRRAAAQQYQLSETERAVLRWLHRGGDAAHAAADLHLTPKQVYRIYKAVKIKMGRDDIRACTRMAAEAGLFDL
ncbi:autoinducer binding domain-containing protein [Paraburkholderia acidicola]|uniref:Autoinducer binding domain-containing protein n=1 Tax=Paraburkholderia acidicola TaxID=1912599 RepID=A0ABV1LMZ7_9BURK